MPAPEKRIEKLEAKSERQQATIGRLQEKIADMKAKRAAARSAKASPAKRAAPKRRKSTRSTQASAAA